MSANNNAVQKDSYARGAGFACACVLDRTARHPLFVCPLASLSLHLAVVGWQQSELPLRRLCFGQGRREMRQWRCEKAMREPGGLGLWLFDQFFPTVCAGALFSLSSLSSVSAFSTSLHSHPSLSPNLAMSSGSGAGVRPIGSAATISSPKAVKTQGSAKKKTKSATPKAAAAASSSSAAPRIDHLSAASSLDTAAAAASVALTAQAHASAFPLLNRPFNPDEDADEEIDEAELQKQMEEMMAEDSVPSVQSTTNCCEPLRGRKQHECCTVQSLNCVLLAFVVRRWFLFFSFSSPRPLTLEIIRQRCLPRELVESGNQELMSAITGHTRACPARAFRRRRDSFDGSSDHLCSCIFLARLAH